MPSTLRRSIEYRGGRARIYPEGATGTASKAYNYGDLVKLNAGVVEAFLDPTANANADGSVDILGMVLEQNNALGANSTAYDTPVLIPTDDFEMLMPIWSATPANSEYSAYNEGDYFTVRMQGGIYVANADATSTSMAPGAQYQIQLVKKVPTEPTSDTYPFGWFKVVPAARRVN